jgi:tripartite-type tricarboxylate transporter receptor subunit TctC
MLLFVGESVASRRASSDAVAQTYPTRPITLVIPFPSGGGNDTL